LPLTVPLSCVLNTAQCRCYVQHNLIAYELPDERLVLRLDGNELESHAGFAAESRPGVWLYRTRPFVEMVRSPMLICTVSRLFRG